MRTGWLVVSMLLYNHGELSDLVPNEYGASMEYIHCLLNTKFYQQFIAFRYLETEQNHTNVFGACKLLGYMHLSVF